jgi:hypothetical protein
VVPLVFKTSLGAVRSPGGFDSLPSPPTPETETGRNNRRSEPFTPRESPKAIAHDVARQRLLSGINSATQTPVDAATSDIWSLVGKLRALAVGSNERVVATDQNMEHDLPPKSFATRLRSGGFEEWQLHRCHEPADRCPLRNRRGTDAALQEPRLRCLDIQTVDAAVRRLGVCVTQSDDMMTLRHVIGDEAFALSRVGDHQIIEHVATMVARREICLVVSFPVLRPAFVQARNEPAPATSWTPSQLRPRTDEPPSIDIGEFLAVQAGVLVQAARTGEPLCEH